MAVFARLPDIVVSVGVIHRLAALDEPGVLVRGVVDHQVHHNADAPLMGLGQQGVEVLHGAKPGVDGPVVGDVVAVVVIRRAEHGREPQRVDAERRKVVKAA